jgi:formylmethanofuran dehydrogenase subunit E
MDLTALFKLSSARHDHLCPRQVLGVRMGLAGLGAIGVEAPIRKKAAVVFIETDGCFADGIEVATGATVGHRTLRVADLGRIGATFANVRTGQAVRLAPAPGVREKALAYAPEIRTKYYAQLKAYQVMPERELFNFTEVELDPPLKAVLSRPGLRVRCAVCGEEIINERQVVIGRDVTVTFLRSEGPGGRKEGDRHIQDTVPGSDDFSRHNSVPVCLACAGRGYYRVLER